VSRLVIFLAFIMCVSNPVHAEEWMGLEESNQTTIGIQTSTDKNDNQSHSLTLFTTLGASFNLDIDLMKNQLKDESNTLDSTRQLIQVSWLGSETSEFHLAQQFEGKARELEINQTQIQFDYSPYPWTVSLHYIEGDVDIYTQQNPLILRPIPDVLNSNFSATGLSFSWWFEAFILTYSQTDYHYEKEITQISSKPLLQLIVKPEAFIHSATLLSQEQELSVQIPFDSRSFTLHYQSISSAVDLSSNAIVSIDWAESITSNILLLSQLSQTLIEDGPWSLSLGLEWTF